MASTARTQANATGGSRGSAAGGDRLTQAGTRRRAAPDAGARGFDERSERRGGAVQRFGFAGAGGQYGLAVVAEGEAGRHQTAAGEDVTGFRYITFEGGLKLYYQPGLDLILVHE